MTAPPSQVAASTPVASPISLAAAPSAAPAAPGGLVYDVEMYPGLLAIGVNASSLMLGISGSAGVPFSPMVSLGFLASANLAVGFPQTVTMTLIGPEARVALPFLGAWARVGGGLGLAGAETSAPGLGAQLDLFVPISRGLGPMLTGKVLLVQGVPVYLLGVGAGFSN